MVCMSRISRLLSLTALLVAYCTSCFASNSSRSVHFFTGDYIPLPPQQQSPWMPPSTRLPESLIDATDFLFKHGMADPRGCEYREIEIVIGGFGQESGGKRLRTHGWVLPKMADNWHFAVAWNGLTYPVFAVGVPANLNADVMALIKADGELARKHETPIHGFAFDSEYCSVHYSKMSLLKVCLLLRLGQRRLAEKYWDCWTVGMSINYSVSYFGLSKEWAWEYFDRTIRAFERKDDHLALSGAQALAILWSELERDTAKRDSQNWAGIHTTSSFKGVYYDFLTQIPTLLADLHRRVKTEAHKRPFDKELATFPDQSTRIRVLIDDLDNLSTPKKFLPNINDLANDPVVQALIKEGDAAIGPLLECVETDNRLTRFVEYQNYVSDAHEHVFGVWEIAHFVIEEILQTHIFEPVTNPSWMSTMAGRRVEASRIRKYWQTYGKMQPAERWYAVLADDDASTEQWLDAAQRITFPVNASNAVYGCVDLVPNRSADILVLNGEVLRAKKNLSVTELMIKRTNSMLTAGHSKEERLASLKNSCKMALHLSHWDIQAALPILADEIKRCQHAIAGNQPYGDNYELEYYIAEMSIQRISGGDRFAVEDYIQWLRTTVPHLTEYSIPEFLEPLWRFPDNVLLNSEAERVFNDVASPWEDMTNGPKQWCWTIPLGHLIDSPLIGVDGFKNHVLRKLSDKSMGGTIKMREGLWTDIKLNNDSMDAYYCNHEPPLPPVEKEFTGRVCDIYAIYVTQLDGAPRFEFYWSEDRKYKAIEACISFLQQYGRNFRFKEFAAPFPPVHRDVILTFPQMDHPATPDDVRRGQAIFTLQGKGEVRVKNISQPPLKAKWVKLKQFPYIQIARQYDSEKEAQITKYEQDGFVWQAEQLFVNGKWVDYYGFVGKHGVWMVPGSELVFVDQH